MNLKWIVVRRKEDRDPSRGRWYKRKVKGGGYEWRCWDGPIPHDKRRSGTRNLTRAGVPVTIAMEITGHKTRTMYDRYDAKQEQEIARL